MDEDDFRALIAELEAQFREIDAPELADEDQYTSRDENTGEERMLEPRERLIAMLRAFDPLAAAELGDTVLAAQTFQHDADLVFGREISPCCTTDVLHDLCRRFFPRHGFLSHLRSLRGLR